VSRTFDWNLEVLAQVIVIPEAAAEEVSEETKMKPSFADDGTFGETQLLEEGKAWSYTLPPVVGENSE